jgi:hypothetical protein
MQPSTLFLIRYPERSGKVSWVAAEGPLTVIHRGQLYSGRWIPQVREGIRVRACGSEDYLGEFQIDGLRLEFDEAADLVSSLSDWLAGEALVRIE